MQSLKISHSLSTATSDITDPMLQLNQQFEVLYRHSRENPMPSWAQRLENLNKLEKLLTDHQKSFIQAICQDFGHRSHQETQIAELFPCFQALKYAKKRGKSWMKVQKSMASIFYFPAHNEKQPQPLGVVGIIVPWNYPLYLSIAPMIDALTAGNRLMVKMSEHAPHFAQAFAQAISSVFTDDTICIITGDVKISQAFCKLPFDHLLYTGSTQVGKKVMSMAADNLTPVTLELGGKSPTIILDDADLEHAVNRTMMGKTLNAGQTCIAPDYVLLHRKHHQKFVQLAKSWVQAHYPDIANNSDYTHLINQQQFSRVQRYLQEQPADKIYPLSETTANHTTRLMPPVIVLEPDLNSQLMQNELFAPILPIIHIDHHQDAIQFINQRPRPLACYVFGKNKKTIKHIRQHTTSGGMCINQTLMHIAQHDLPFGGIGHSGIGAYHGRTGFERFSHIKPVFVQSKLNGLNLLLPPYGKLVDNMMKWFLR